VNLYRPFKVFYIEGNHDIYLSSYFVSFLMLHEDRFLLVIGHGPDCKLDPFHSIQSSSSIRIFWFPLSRSVGFLHWVRGAIAPPRRPPPPPPLWHSNPPSPRNLGKARGTSSRPEFFPFIPPPNSFNTKQSSTTLAKVIYFVSSRPSPCSGNLFFIGFPPP